jgi:predicted 3-demethylubiquinone-9 3-methyltransferase (glyoxalase superfamily)
MARYGDAGAEVSGRPKGTVMTVAFQLEGQEFVALNGGPQIKFTEAISFVVNCQTQEEIGPLFVLFKTSRTMLLNVQIVQKACPESVEGFNRFAPFKQSNESGGFPIPV